MFTNAPSYKFSSYFYPHITVGCIYGIQCDISVHVNSVWQPNKDAACICCHTHLVFLCAETIQSPSYFEMHDQHYHPKEW